MSKFKEIVDGWRYVVFPNQEVEKVALERAKVCGTCPENKNGRCLACGCFLQAKARSPKSTCPLNKWPK